MTGSRLMERYRDEIVHHISELVQIRSVQEEGEAGKPFGSGVNRALEYMLDLAASMGFRTKNVDGYAGHAEYGAGDRLTAVLVHLDTVQEGEGWTYPPFGGTVEEGRIIGRGASDNKGPAVVALYCLKAIRDQGIPIRSRIRIIFGTNEESGMKDLDYYFSKEPLPDYAFVPDAGYPIFNVEMGNANVAVTCFLDRQKEEEKLRIDSLTGGVPMVLVPEKCEVRFRSGHFPESGWQAVAAGSSNVTAWRKENGAAVLTADGKAAGEPRNAIADLMKGLAALPMKTDADPMIAFLNDKLGHETDGRLLGIHRSDEVSGSTVVFLKQIYTEGDLLTAVINIRYPVKEDGDRLLGLVADQAEAYGLQTAILRHLRPVYVPPEHPVIRILSRVYERVTGEKAVLLRMGAGTYARKLRNNGVAFGAGLPGGVDTHVHRPDEFVRIEDMMRHADISFQALRELSSEETEPC
ncbi:Sapep family Mn(2+)-dependent dipeptidase [Paenibacillus aurantius]|uniref:Sapep family Mn(2+)-dependent dipeptidase n=1 Tax=Paenibacillus aurantius TaxID=2918900 RepID=A0AA96LH95_9BACL|nr:Sapep family Mn(2+)-dependent dipeptidase [Paenibacillus aurantius]WNQ13897.1 Sapep family Mn(2+)-dependent dipeptidase [Paenibacillus aurantius]